jgi:hypothetical protein
MTTATGCTLALGACSSSSPAASSTSSGPTTSSPASTTTGPPPTTEPPAPFLPKLGKATQLASTVPANGDINPYGVAVVPSTTGSVVAGDVLVSNVPDGAGDVFGLTVGDGGHELLFVNDGQNALDRAVVTT